MLNILESCQKSLIYRVSQVFSDYLIDRFLGSLIRYVLLSK